ncbi:MAG: arabinan endo-1,5-alpha-L-arabinosidase [Tepidisphaeraceae bacterium]
MFSALAFGQVGDVIGVHDPAMIKQGDTYYLFATGRGIPVRTSKDLVTWKRAGTVFGDNPAWAQDAIPTARDAWAPDISRVGDEFRLYYAVSKFGTSQSVIGLMTNTTLDPADPKFKWVDRGEILRTNPGDNWNAIDAAAFVDEQRQPWLAVGSFWTGIKLFKLDSAGRVVAGDKPRSIARRLDADGAVEAAFVTHRDGWYYLWVSFDTCCRGAESTYNVRVGRGKSPEGPYVDRDGRPMLQGGGTPVTKNEGNIRGPGHNAVFSEGGVDYLVHHWYDADHRGRRTLAVRKLTWDADGWPHPGPLLAPATQPATAPATP